MEKETNIKVGDELYLKNAPCKGATWCYEDVKDPYAVIGVADDCITIQACHLIFDGPVYYNSMPKKIIADKYGEVKKLVWSKKFGSWVFYSYKGDRYPKIAVFGCYEYFPYLD